LTYRGTKAHRGTFAPQNPHKYVGDVKFITWRSTWERRFFRFCDTSPGVLRWASEEVIIPYISPLDGRMHRYFPDVWMEVMSKTGKRQLLIEIKPAGQTAMPAKRRKTQKFLQEAMTFAVNRAKWDAAEIFCKQKQWQFVLVTEKELFSKFNGK